MSIGKIVIAGGTGFIGQGLVRHLHALSSEIVVLSRHDEAQLSNQRLVKWDARSPGPWQAELENCDVLINLTGKSIQCRFTEANKKILRSSRIDSTQILRETIKGQNESPKIWLNASGNSFYPKGDEPYTEESTEMARDFLGQLTQEWEKEFFADSTISTRRVALRISPVLGKNGGMLKPLKMVTKLGLGGHVGNGKHFMSWIHLNDLAAAVLFIINNEEMNGPVNMNSPLVVSNAQFMAALRSAVGIPFGIPTPEFALRIGSRFIGIEPDLALDSKVILPKKLIDTGFKFNFPDIDSALNDLI